MQSAPTAEFVGAVLEHRGADNLVTARECDAKWARANVLHFLSEREDGAVLKAYNRHAARFLDENNKMIGAYGPIAMPRFRNALSALAVDPSTRRAVFTFTDFSRAPNRNIPACISFGHLLANGSELDLLVYQRSLNAWSVLPYDLVLLTNLLRMAARATALAPGSLRWFVGSLHVLESDLPKIADCDFRRPGASVLVEDLTPDRAWALLHMES